MFKHYVKVAIRQIKRSFLFSSINMLGFVLGMTAAFLIYLWIVDELTFEDFNKNGDYKIGGVGTFFEKVPEGFFEGGECDFYKVWW